MRRVVPYPVLTIVLIGMWLLLQQSLALGHILLGTIVALAANHAAAAIEPYRPRFRRPGKILKLIGLVVADVVRSNIDVSRIIVSGRQENHTSAFVLIPLQLRDPMGLAILSCIVTATPGSAWVEYNAAHSTVLIHVFDLVDADGWIEMLKERYESLLVEIFQ